MKIERHKPSGPVILFSGVILLFTGLAVGLFLRTYESVVLGAFRDRSTAYAQTFAASVSGWADRSDVVMLEAAARLILAESILFVEVSGPQGVLLDLRTTRTPDDVDAISVEDPLSLSTTIRRAPGGFSYLDIVAPLAATDPTGGYVRIGIDETEPRVWIRNAQLLGSITAAAFDGMLLLFLAWVMRRHHQSLSRQGGAATESRREQPLTIGDLVIVPSRRSVRFAGHPVRVTPKEYTLLVLLASEPGRVFSERDILDAVWPDSPYADAKDVKQYVYLLRRKLGAAREDGRRWITNVPGFGYRLEPGPIDPALTAE